MLAIVEFINRNANDGCEENWSNMLTEKPYSLKIRVHNDYILLEYTMASDFNLPIVRECRGLILKAVSKTCYVPVCVPFFKFGNYGESYCPEIDWESARVQEKIDGSLIKCWYDEGKWHTSTSGSIDANMAFLMNGHDIKYENGECATFGKLFDRVAMNNGLDYGRLAPALTYMFELCTPENQVVVPYTETKLYHIGTRNNATLEESSPDIGIPKPQEYRLHSVEECIEAAKALHLDSNGGEGFVVVDKHWNRVKIKNPTYVLYHNLINNNIMTTERIINLVRSGNRDEFLVYFPKYRERIEAVEQQIEELTNILSNRVDALAALNFETQKEFALAVKDDRFSAFFFENRKTGITADKWLNRMESWRLAIHLERED